jgi:hypothetical protein
MIDIRDGEKRREDDHDSPGEKKPGMSSQVLRHVPENANAMITHETTGQE